MNCHPHPPPPFHTLYIKHFNKQFKLFCWVFSLFTFYWTVFRFGSSSLFCPNNFLYMMMELRARTLVCWHHDVGYLCSISASGGENFPSRQCRSRRRSTPDRAAGANFCRFKTDFPPLSGSREQEKEQSVTEGGGGSSARLRQLQSNPPWPVSESAVSWMAWRCQRARQPQEMMTASSIAALLTRTIGLFGYSSANISTEVIFLNQVVQGGSGRR